jgi:hypothetical protein
MEAVERAVVDKSSDTMERQRKQSVSERVNDCKRQEHTIALWCGVIVTKSCSSF